MDRTDRGASMVASRHWRRRFVFLALLAAALSTGIGANATSVVKHPSLKINDTPTQVGSSGQTIATFTVTLSGESRKSVTVDFATSDGTAEAGLDYWPASGTLAFPKGETTKTLDVVINGHAGQGDKTYFVTLSNASNAVISDGSGFGVIQYQQAPELPPPPPPTPTPTPTPTNPPPAAHNLSVSVKRSEGCLTFRCTPSVTIEPIGFTCEWNCDALVEHGLQLTITANGAGLAGEFGHWGGVCSGSNPTCTVAIYEDHQVVEAYYCTPIESC